MGQHEPFELAVAVVVVTHDSARWVAGFFESWERALGRVAGLREKGVRVVVVDSGSGDETVKRVREMRPSAVVLECGNVGYGAAANRGVEACGEAEWVMVCNADLTFGEDFLEKMAAAIPRRADGELVDALRRVGCIGPRLLNEDGSVQASVGVFPGFWGLVRDRFRERVRRKYVWPQPVKAGVVSWISGACLLVNRRAFEKVGGFDEKYFLYVEEVDLMRRMGLAGHCTWFEPGAMVVHHAPNASRAVRAEVQRWAARGLLRYFAKFGGWWQLRGYGVLAVLSGRLGFSEAFGSRARILERSTRESRMTNDE